MALFPHLSIEKKVQVKDMTRMNAKRSFASRGSDPLTSMTVTPGADGSAVNVFSSTVDNRFLEWQFNTFSIDIDSTNNKLDFNEGGAELTATLSSTTYTLAALASEIQTQLNATGALTYTVSVSVDDKVTIAADGSFSLLPQTGTNTLVSILPILNITAKPGFGDNDYGSITTVTGDRVRWMPRAVTLQIGDGTGTSSVTEYINVYSEGGDALFSDDADLIAHKYDILDWLPEGRNTYKHMHRRAQQLILEYLNRAGYVDLDGDPLELKAFTQPDEVKDWSIYLTLRLIFDDLSNDPDDDFFAKARDYEHLEEVHRNRAILRLDTDNDGKADIGEGVLVLGGEVLRR